MSNMESKINIEKMSFKQIDKLKLIRNGDIGANGKVYMLNDHECLKVFEYYKDLYDLEKFHEFTTCNLETVEMPKKLVSILGIFSGYISNYIDGPMLCECGNFDYSELLVLYNKFIRKACDEISELGLMIVDPGSTNILLDKSVNGFKMVDPDLWIKQRDMKVSDIKSINFNKLNTTFGKYILFMFDRYIDINADFIDFYENYRIGVEDKHNVKIKTIDDMRNTRIKGLFEG